MIRSAVVCIFAALLIVACTRAVEPPLTGGSPAAPQLPPRPHDLRIEELDLCSVFDAAAREVLGVSAGEYEPANQVIGDLCRWSHYPQEPVESYYVVRELNSGAASAMNAPRGAKIDVILGYGAVITQGVHDDPHSGCLILIDVADENALKVSYGYNGSTLPMTRELACQKARKAAELAMATILAQG